MEKELIISQQPDGVQIALTEDKKLVELHKEQPGGQFAVGDIYFGKVRKIMTGLNAAFIDLGGDKEGFMHYLDLGKAMADIGSGHIIFTDISRDGRLEGLNVDATAALARASGVKVIASGGVAGLDDIRRAKAREADGIEGVILGCTELPLLLNEGNCPVPCLDAVEIHLKKLIELAM